MNYRHRLVIRKWAGLWYVMVQVQVDDVWYPWLTDQAATFADVPALAESLWADR